LTLEDAESSVAGSRLATTRIEVTAGFEMHCLTTWLPIKPVAPVTMSFMLAMGSEIEAFNLIETLSQFAHDMESVASKCVL
jgi:hypothetical protein